MRYLSPVPAAKAQGIVGEIYRQVRREFGLLGAPLAAHSQSPLLLAAVWVAARETILAGEAKREVKEAVAVAVSLSNDCPYCVDAHTMMLRAASSHDAARSARLGLADRITDPAVREAAVWAAHTTPEHAPARDQRPFPPEQAAEIIGTVAWMHYINRIVSVFIGRRLIFAPRFGGLRSLCERAGGLFLSTAVKRSLVPGEALRFVAGLSPGRVPEWTSGAREVAAAFSALDSAAETAGGGSVAPEVRGWARAEIEGWDGTRTPISRSWLTERLGRLPPGERPVGRLVLLSAVAPWQINRNDVAEFRRFHAADTELLGAVSWAAWTAARRISSWL